MTTSIPVFLADPMAPATAAAANPPTGDAGPTPDFAGLLAGAATAAPTVAAMVPAMAIFPAGISDLAGMAPADSAPVENAAVEIVPGQPAASAFPVGSLGVAGPSGDPDRPAVGVSSAGIGEGGGSVAGNVAPFPGPGIARAVASRQFAQATGRRGPVAPSPAAAATETARASEGPTRAEQEQAMALLAGLFPMLPAVVLPVAPLILAVGEESMLPGNPVPAPGMGEVSDETRPELVPAGQTEASACSPVRAGFFSKHGLGLNPGGPAPIDGPAESASVRRSGSGGELQGAWPARAGNPTDRSADLPDDLSVAPDAAVAVSAPPPAVGIAAGKLPESALPSEGPAEPVAPALQACSVIEAAAVRPDGVHLARRSSLIATGASHPMPGVENSAGEPAISSVSAEKENRAPGKKLLRSFEQGFAEGQPDSGTTVANSGSNMNPRAPISFVAPAQGRGAEEILRPSGTPAGRETAELAAPRVVSTILEVVEAQEASKLRPVPAVHLRMQVAGETVGIKVELRDDAVQTRFTAVSPELREALTREWQSARNETRDGAPRLLDPVFNANASTGGPASAGHDAASQQQHQARTWGFPWEQSGNPSARRPRPASAPDTDTPSSSAPVADSRLLSAIA